MKKGKKFRGQGFAAMTTDIATITDTYQSSTNPNERYSPKFQHLVNMELNYSELAVKIKNLIKSASKKKRKNARKIIKAEFSIKDVPNHIHHGRHVKFQELLYVYPVDIVNHIIAEFGYVISIKLEKIEKDQ